jgi:hypothetical protein
VSASLNVRYRQLLQEDVRTARLAGSERDQFLRKNLQVMAGGRGKSTFRDQFATPLIVVMAMVGLVLIVACANVANLMLARAAARQKDVALRLALGASRWRIVRQRLAESVVLAAGGTVVGLLIASWTTRLLIQMLPLERAASALSSELDIRIVSFALAAAAATVVLFGLAPALQARSAAALTMALKETGRVAGGGRQAGFRKALVIAQVALSMLLLAGAGLFARSLHNLRELDPGFVPDNLLHFSLDSSRSGYTRDRALGLAKTLQEQLRGLPGVTSVSMAIVPAMTGRQSRQTVRVQGYDPPDGEDMTPSINLVGPGYFETLGRHHASGVLRRVRPARDGESGHHSLEHSGAFQRSPARRDRAPVRRGQAPGRGGQHLPAVRSGERAHASRAGPPPRQDRADGGLVIAVLKDSSANRRSDRARDSCSVPTARVKSPMALPRADCGSSGARRAASALPRWPWSRRCSHPWPRRRSGRPRRAGLRTGNRRRVCPGARATDTRHSTASSTSAGTWTSRTARAVASNPTCAAGVRTPLSR